MRRETLRGNVSLSHGGLYASIRTLARTLIESVRARLQLLSLEIAEEQARIGELLLLAAASLVCMSLGLIFSVVFLVLLFWDTPYRMWIAGLVPVIFLGAAAIFAWAFRNWSRSRARLFSESLQEMVKDIDQLNAVEKRPVPR